MSFLISNNSGRIGMLKCGRRAAQLMLNRTAAINTNTAKTASNTLLRPALQSQQRSTIQIQKLQYSTETSTPPQPPSDIYKQIEGYVQKDKIVCFIKGDF
jgi:hypothetical protein